MKKYIIPVVAAMLLSSTNTSAQTDSRNRTAETIVIDGLAQLPTQSSKTYNTIIDELASTGEKGIQQISSQLAPPAKGKNAVYEYALGGITDYVTTTKGEKYRASVRKGLAQAIEKCSDPDNKAFLITQLAKCATPDDMSVLSKYLQDDKLSKYAIAAVSSIPGNETALTYLVKESKLPRIELAKIVSLRKLQGVEDVLLGWTDETDTKTLNQVYNALATVGTSKSVKTLAEAAKKTQYMPDATNATNSYAKLLENLSNDTKDVQAGGKALTKSKNAAYRCTGLELLLKSAGKNGSKTVISALKDDCIQYRNTALAFAPEYCGDGIFTTVAANYKKLSTPAKTDVVRWMGNNHAKAGEQIIIESFASSDTTLAQAAIAAASKIGGNNMLTALVKEISGTNSKAATSALLSFNGEINSEIVKVLGSNSDAKTLVPALQIAGTRHIHSAYSKVAQLTASSDATISEAAYSALAGVASPEVYSDICNMLDKSQGNATTKLQKAAASSIAAQSSDKQYELITASMNKSSHPEYYYPLLAQAGNDQAIATIEKGMAQSTTSKAASDAMLKVDNSAVLPTLIKMAAKADNTEKDKILSRYLTLTNKSGANAVSKYLLLRDALSLKPSDALTNRILSALGSTNTVQALAVSQAYISKDANARSAAEAVRAIISHNDALNGGDAVRSALQKSKDVFAKEKAGGDADAGYAMDDVNGLMSKTSANGFSLTSSVLGDNAQNSSSLNTKIESDKNYENFSLTFDWRTAGTATVVLRGVPMITLKKDGVCTIGDQTLKTANSDGWNNMEVRVVDDRIFITSNGVAVATNASLPEVAAAKTVPTTGAFKISGTDGDLSIRDFNICELPSTPVFKLSAEEEKAGFEVLFDGRSLEKWQGNKSNYVPQEGNIYVTANYGGSGNLYTNKKYSDFVYRFEFCFAQPGVNNGIGIRTNIGSDAAYDGMEIQVLDHDDPIYEGLQKYQQHGSVYGIIVPKHVTFGKLGTWNTEEIRAVGDHITVTVNGEVILDGNIREACQGHNVAPDGGTKNPYTVDHKNHPGLFNKDGYISFCGHGPGVKFRNVRILDLSKKSAKQGKSSKKRR